MFWRGFTRTSLLGVLLLAGPAQAMSLREAVQQAVLTNPRIEASQANQRATRYGLEVPPEDRRIGGLLISLTLLRQL